MRAINVLAIQLGRTLEAESRNAPASAIQAAVFENVRQRVFDTPFYSPSPAAKSLNSVQLEGRFSSPGPSPPSPSLALANETAAQPNSSSGSR